MTAIGELGVSVIALAGMLPLTLGLVALVLAGNAQIKVHALSLAGVGPLLLLLSAPAWGDGRTLLTALILSAAMLLTTAISGHAIMRLVAARETSGPERLSDAGEPGLTASGEGDRD
ncbi:MAG TPA: hypothetical protein VFJ13_00265 [Paracoccaceae bacterium]|nr:hypothetical protein [Paracoccaceae bacterium]